LKDLVVASVPTDERRREVEAMVRTGADELREEGMEQGLRQGGIRTRQEMLLVQLRARFKKVPKAVERTVRATDDVARLDSWIERFAIANTLVEVGIASDR
jgi:hypothetical protein